MRVFIRFVIVLSIALDVSGCSRSQPKIPGNVSLPTSEKSPADIYKLYNPESLGEVRQFADLPVEVQSLANGTFMKENLDNTPTKFLVGGASKSSAIVAYEQFGYVPFFFAQSYVYNDSHWVAAKRWPIGSEVNRLTDLNSATAGASTELSH